MPYLQTLPPLQFKYYWRIQGDVAEVVPSRAALPFVIAFVWISALCPAIIAPFFRVEVWFEVLGTLVGVLMASAFTWYSLKEFNRPPPWRVDLKAGTLQFNATTIPFDQIRELRVTKELSAPATDDRIHVYTLYAVLKDDSQEAIAAFPWKPWAIDLGKKTAEMIGVPLTS
jgi:hypothetical protein